MILQLAYSKGSAHAAGKISWLGGGCEGGCAAGESLMEAVFCSERMCVSLIGDPMEQMP